LVDAVLNLSKFRKAHVCILLDCLQSTLDASWKMEENLLFFFVYFSTHKIYSIYNRNKQKQHWKRILFAIFFSMHTMKINPKALGSLWVMYILYHWLFLPAVKLLWTDFVMTHTVQNRLSHCTWCYVHVLRVEIDWEALALFQEFLKPSSERLYLICTQK